MINVKRPAATLLRDRPERLMISPIVFVANGSYTSREGALRRKIIRRERI